MRLRNWMVDAGIVVAALGFMACGDIDQTGLVGLEDCTNEVDDNGDGLADCDDPQCTGHAYCLPYRELNCVNGVDDDDDGPVDCADTDCAQHPSCEPESELACNDGVDNDNDGLTDCDDDNCWQADVCQEKCDDGVDNDGDGLIDCVDDQCWQAPVCQSEDCTNGVDDDGDGDTDCEDADCEFGPDCTWIERCDDGVDNDYDGLADCDDPDCATNPWCTETLCADSEDNDENGLVDCDDPSCLGRPGCVPNTTCQPAATIYCDYLISGTTVGRYDNRDTYNCVPGNFTGGEQYYHLAVFPGAEVNVQLTDFSIGGHLQMVLLEGDSTGPGCAPSNDCVSPTVSGSTDQTLSMEPAHYADLYIVVDSSGPGGDFNLYVTCEPLVETLCEDGADNDHDGLIDCADPDCWLGATCILPTELCNDNVDNDFDGLIDCADSDCQGSTHCENAESTCDDGLDNDSDGAVDCADPDCWLDASCSGGETSCTNLIDDDSDGAVDCMDWDCVGDGGCDWWFDYDTACVNNSVCGPPDHYCVTVGQQGFCTRPCSTPGAFDGECDTGTNLQGICVPGTNGTGSLCVLPCGQAYPGRLCPATWSCVTPDPSHPQQGVCVQSP